jgi:hypothetical protein
MEGEREEEGERKNKIILTSGSRGW